MNNESEEINAEFERIKNEGNCNSSSYHHIPANFD